MASPQHGNVTYALLDAAVIAGRADEPVVVGQWTHARLLEEVAALGGVLTHLGVGPGSPVVIDLADDTDAVVAALATARVGGVVTTREDPTAPVTFVSAPVSPAAPGQRRLVRPAAGEEAREPDLDWAVMLRAGRTDPAACVVLDPGATYSPGRSIAEQVAILASSPAPYTPEGLRHLLGV